MFLRVFLKLTRYTSRLAGSHRGVHISISYTQDDSKGCLERVLRSCLSFKPKSRPPILGPNGLLSHPFLTRAEPTPTSITLSRGDLQQVIRQACAAVQRCSADSLLKWASDASAIDRFMVRFASEGVVSFDVPQRQRRRTGESPALKKSKPSVSEPSASKSSKRLSGGAARARLDSTLQNAIKKGKLKKRKKRKSLRSKPKEVQTPKETSVQSMLDRRRAFMGLSPTGTDTDSDWTLYTELLR